MRNPVHPGLAVCLSMAFLSGAHTAHAQGARTEKAPRKGDGGSGAKSTSQASPRPLPAGVPSAALESAETHVLFSTKAFPSVQVGDVFAVLNARRDGVVARVKVGEMGATGQAICTLVEGGRGWALQNEGLQAGALRVVREQDALLHAAAFARGPLVVTPPTSDSPYAPPLAGSATNAVVQVGLLAEFPTVDAADLYAQRRVAPRALSSGLQAEVFLPPMGPRLRVFNWLGVRVTFDTATAKGIPWELGSTLREGGVEVTRLVVSPGLRATFDHRVFSRVGLFYDAVSKETSTFTGDGGAKGSSSQSSPALTLAWEAQPVKGLLAFLAGSRTLGAKGTVKKQDSVGALEVGTKSTRTSAEGGLGVRVFSGTLPHALGVETRLGARFQTHETTFEGGGASSTAKVWTPFLSIAAGYVP